MDERIRKFLDANPSKNLLSYEPLTIDKSFRLVELLPGSCEDDGVSLTLAQHKIQNYPPYEALSYTWGQNVDIVYVQCNDCELAITTSLAEALRQFRLTDRPRRLWIDQCCIDQSNVDERSNQVKMMRQIYSNADQVLSWLGPASRAEGTMLQKLLDQFEATIDMIFSDLFGSEKKVTVAALPLDDTVPGSKHVFVLNENRSEYPSDEWLTKFCLPVVAAPEWTLFENFLCNVYFQRIWIIQEIQSSSFALLKWGEAEVKWSQVHNAVRFCIANGCMERRGLPGTGWVRFLSPFVSLKGNTLSQWLAMTKYHQCTDARDRIFALVGISSSIGDGPTTDDDVKLEANYDLSWEKTCRNAVKAVCKAGSRLRILSDLQHNRPSHSSSLPSWIGDFDSEPVLSDFQRSGRFACGQTSSRILDNEDDDVLATRGFVTDRIVAIEEPITLPEISLGNFRPVNGRQFEDAWSLLQAFRAAESSSPSPSSSSETGLLKSDISALTQTLRCSAAYWQVRPDLQRAEIENLLSFAKYQIDGSIASLQGIDSVDSSLAGRATQPFYPEAGVQATICAALALEEDIEVFKSTTNVASNQLALLRHIVNAVFMSNTLEERESKLRLLIGATAIVQQYASYLPTMTSIAFAYDPLNVRNRRFFVTETGNIGLAPGTAQVGDRICIFYGGPVPYAIRAAGDGKKHLFVGACYVHGFMDGQAIELKDINGYVEEDIILR